LVRNDFAIIPQGRAHLMCDQPDRAPTDREWIPGEQAAQPVRIDLPSDGTVLLCGYFRYAEVLPWLLWTRLPELLILRGDGQSEQDVSGSHDIMQLVMAESARERIASSQILNRCMEILFLLALRDWAGREARPGGALALLTGEQIDRALAAMQDEPERAWTVESLAQIAGQSRTMFAQMFRDAVGLTPIDYLNRQRMDIARKLLVETDLRIDDIALRAGYRDASAFSRAFSREVGVPPAEYRKAARE
jgi:AraC-like DNA-binding protein